LALRPGSSRARSREGWRKDPQQRAIQDSKYYMAQIWHMTGCHPLISLRYFFVLAVAHNLKVAS
jgi:hypothetical protein